VLLQQGEIHLAIFALALCLNADAPHCHTQMCPIILANTTMRVYFETVLLRNLGWRIILEKHLLLVPMPLTWQQKALLVCHNHIVPWLPYPLSCKAYNYTDTTTLEPHFSFDKESWSRYRLATAYNAKGSSQFRTVLQVLRKVHPSF
jgi:hypothetical protein